MKIAFKAGIRELRNLKNIENQHFEAFIKHNDDLEKLIYPNLNLRIIHFPNKVFCNGSFHYSNLLDTGNIGKTTISYLKKIIDFSDLNNVKYIVIHPGFYNELKFNKNTELDRLSNILNSINTKSVKLCIENIPRWPIQAFTFTPIISDYMDIEYIAKRCKKIGFTYDIDHIAIDTVFKDFLKNSIPDFTLAKDKVLFRKSLFHKIKNEAINSQAFYTDKINNTIKEFFEGSVEPDIIHAVGSDFTNYGPFNNLPWVGEALPLYHKGQIMGKYVNDKINHQNWLSLLRGNETVTLEFMMRPEYDYLETFYLNKSIVISNCGLNEKYN